MTDHDGLPDALKEGLRASARALALLHTAQSISGDANSMHQRFLEAATAFEEALAALELPANRFFLARCYAGASRFQEALTTLSQLGDDPPEAADELAKLSAEARERIIKGAVRHNLSGTLPTPEELIDWNRNLIDDRLAADIHETAIYYADRSDQEIGNAVGGLLSTLREATSNPLWEAIRLEAIGVRDISSGRSQRALVSLRAAEAIYRDLGIAEYNASIANHLGLAHSDRGQFAESTAAFSESVALYRDLDLAMAARVLENYAASLMKQKRFEAARGAAEEAVVILDQAGRSAQADKARLVVAHAMSEAGDWDEALSLIDEVLSRSRSSWVAYDIDTLVSALTRRGYILEAAGLIGEAERSLDEAASVQSTTRTAQGATWRVERSGIASQTNSWDIAVQEELRALAAHEDAGNEFDAARNKLNLAKLFMNRMAALPFSSDESEAVWPERAADLVQAATLLREIVPVFSKADVPRYLQEARRSQAMLQWMFGDVDGAVSNMRSVIQDAVTAGDFMLAGSVSQNLARVCFDLGLTDEVRAAVSEGRRYATRAKDASLVWHLDWIEARLLREAGDIEEAGAMYLSLIQRHVENEHRVGSAGLVLAWSRDKTFVFDDAVEHFLETNQAGPAYAIVLAAKGRTYVAEMTTQSGRPPARSARDIAQLLSDETSRSRETP